MSFDGHVSDDDDIDDDDDDNGDDDDSNNHHTKFYTRLGTWHSYIVTNAVML